MALEHLKETKIIKLLETFDTHTWTYAQKYILLYYSEKSNRLQKLFDYLNQTKKETEFGKFTWENESLQKKTVFNAYRKGEFNSTNLISDCSKLLEVLEQFLCVNLITNNKEQEFNQAFLLANYYHQNALIDGRNKWQNRQIEILNKETQSHNETSFYHWFQHKEQEAEFLLPENTPQKLNNIFLDALTYFDKQYILTKLQYIANIIATKKINLQEQPDKILWFNEIIDVASNCDDKKEPLIKAYYYAILLSLPTRTLTEQEQSLNSLINTITQIAYHNYQFVLPLQTIVINFFAQKISCTEDDWQLLSKMLEVVQKDPSGFISPNHLNNQFKIYLKIGKKEALLNAHQFVKNNITKIAEKYQENINAFFNAYIEFESAHFDKTKVYLGQIYTININYDTQRYRLGIKCYYELNDDAIHSWIDAFSAFLTDNEMTPLIKGL